jgi:hypothetical protein
VVSKRALKVKGASLLNHFSLNFFGAQEAIKIMLTNTSTFFIFLFLLIHFLIETNV